MKSSKPSHLRIITWKTDERFPLAIVLGKSNDGSRKDDKMSLIVS